MAQQAGGMAVAMKRKDRNNLSADTLVKLQWPATEGLIQKFTLMTQPLIYR
jgi:hypothetical protein